MDFSDFNVSIVGLGLIGGSFAKALKKCGFKNLWAIDINQDNLKKAEELNIIDKGFTESSIPLNKSDITIVCLYPELVINFIQDNIKEFKKNSIITDVAGVKSNIVHEIQNLISDDIDFIGGHPIAGKESKGFEISSEKIFENADYILTPTSQNKTENIKLLKEIIRAIKFKKIIEVTVEEHDEMIAYVSQLPHIIATVIMNNGMVDKENICIGGSFKDITRVSNVNSDLWVELLIKNRSNVIKQIEYLKSQLGSIEELLKLKKSNELKRIFDKGREKKERI
ncbi:prephenate dehydrogenase [Clostridium sp. Marseille-Q2269]|uniref:prephenate dehydrogenase n=1 Tax=Clostridium sp. Marseille-Q2269 TaxID=2942205 RepID=UPI002073B672|nr:prephenate dehydrogenase [Clostridium sp. Marseille-Q2269]